MNFHNIIFKKHEALGGFRSVTHFQNGLKLSVSAGEGIYCTPNENLTSINQYLSFELGIVDAERNWVTKEFFPGHNDDVVGWQSRDDINDLMERISNANPHPTEWDEDHALDQVMNDMVKDMDMEDIPGFEGTLDKLNDLTIKPKSNKE